MINETDIQVRMLSSRLAAAENRAAFLQERLGHCVTREEHDAVCAERDLAVSECMAAKAAQAEAEQKSARCKSESAGLRGDLDRARARIDELERLVADLRDELTLARDDKFAPSSEKMEDLLGEEKPLPEGKAGVLAAIAQLVHEADMAMGLDKEEAKEKYKPARGKDKRKRKPRTPSGTKRGVYTKDVLAALGIDTTGVDPQGKVILRNDGPDIWWFIMYYVARPRVYSIKYAITRYNLPGSRFQNSAYPPGIFEKCHLSPSFAALYFRMKFCYNVSEQNIMKALLACGCRIPQPTLNK